MMLFCGRTLSSKIPVDMNSIFMKLYVTWPTWPKEIGIFEVIFVVFRLMKNIVFNKTESFVGRNTSDRACQIVCSKSNWNYVSLIFINGWELNAQSLYITFQGCFLPSFDSFGKAVSENLFFRNQPIRNENCLWRPCLLTIGTKWAIAIEDLPRMLPTKFRFIWQSSFREEDFKKSVNQKQELPVAAMFVNGSEINELFKEGLP